MRFSKRRPDLKFFTCRPAKISNTSGVLELREESRSYCPFWSTAETPTETPQAESGALGSISLRSRTVCCVEVPVYLCFSSTDPGLQEGRTRAFISLKHQWLMNHVVRKLIPFFMEDKWVHSGSATMWLRYKTVVIGGSVHQGQHLGAQAQHQITEDKCTVDIHK